MNVFPSCSFRFGNRFPYPWSQPRNSSGCRLAPQNGPPYALIGAGIVFLAALAGLALLALSLRDALRKRKEAANASEDQSS